MPQQKYDFIFGYVFYSVFQIVLIYILYSNHQLEVNMTSVIHTPDELIYLYTI